MGIINFIPSDKVPEPSISKSAYFRILYTTNWRVILVNKKKDIMTVVTQSFRTFEIYGLTVEEFLANNFTKGDIEKPFKYQGNLLSCAVCRGGGRVDWIQKAVTRYNPEVRKAAYRYRRNINHISKLKPLDIHKDIVDVIYGSVPTLSDGYELCSNCKGTGVNSIRLVKYMEE